MKEGVLIFFTLVFLTGCVSQPDVVPMGMDTYTVTFGGGIGMPNHVGTGPARARVFNTANEFCRLRGLVMVPLAVREEQGVMGRHTAQVELDFRAVPPNDPEAKRPNLQSVQPIQRIEIKKSTNEPN